MCASTVVRAKLRPDHVDGIVIGKLESLENEKRSNWLKKSSDITILDKFIQEVS